MRDQPKDLNRRLKESNASTLRQLWASSKCTNPPKTFTARLMRLALAWDAQAVGEGRETTQVRQAWNRIIKSRNGGGAGDNLAQTSTYPISGDGTRILKDWGGTTHEVLVTEDGASWNGESYSSLSSVARAMTGTHRNGPTFFGLRGAGKS